jgi:hypothetical protein
MTLSHPFTSPNLDRVLILKTLMEQTSELGSSTLEALVISDKSCQEWYISNGYLVTLYNRVIKEIK